MHKTDRAWSEIHLDRLTHNYNELRRHIDPNCRLLAPVKANAYGHGALKVSKHLEALGCGYLATASLPEALELRKGGIALPILIFANTAPEDAKLLAQHNITQTIPDLALAQGLSHALAGTGLTLNVHIKLDSGLGRLGFPCHTQTPTEALQVLSLPHLNVEGIFTHFSVADTEQDDYTQSQLTHFTKAADWLDAASGRTIPIRHAGASAAALRLPETHLDMIRPGLALYGHSPEPSLIKTDLRPVMELKTRIIQVRPFANGEFVSYGKTYEARENRTLATVSIGYADGLHRVLSGRMDMLLHGQRVPQVGRICMDLCMLDVTDVPEKISVGDTVTVFGRDRDKTLSVAEHATLADTIPYELLTAVAARVPRLYLNDALC